jgi:hypothetical protein
MTYRTETPQMSAQYLNAQFVRKITDEGKIKEAAVEGTAFIREKVRQESFAREVIVPVGVQNDELDRSVDTDQPRKIIEKEPASIATYVPFMGSGPRVWFRGPRYEVRFYKIESQRFTKSKFELMTYQNDIRKILSDNSVKDMADVEDQRFLEHITAITALNPAQITPATAFTTTPWRIAMQALARRRRPVGKFLMAKELLYEMVDLPATAVGNEIARTNFEDGVESREKLLGMPVVTTVKSDVIAAVTGNARTAWVFSPENFLGNYFLLQDATLFIKQEADIITFYSYESIGMGIGNRLSVQQLSFN